METLTSSSYSYVAKDEVECEPLTPIEIFQLLSSELIRLGSLGVLSVLINNKTMMAIGGVARMIEQNSAKDWFPFRDVPMYHLARYDVYGRTTMLLFDESGTLYYLSYGDLGDFCVILTEQNALEPITENTGDPRFYSDALIQLHRIMYNKAEHLEAFLARFNRATLKLEAVTDRLRRTNHIH